MTLRERYAALMTDLVAERAGAVEGSWWAARLDQKIADLKAATEERFGGGENGSGSADQQG